MHGLPIICDKEVNRVWHGRIRKTLVDEFCQTHVVVCDENVKINIPDPVVLPGLDNSLNHVKLKPRSPSGRVRFIIDIKIVIVDLSIICKGKNRVSDFLVEDEYVRQKRSSRLRTIFVLKPEMKVCLRTRNEGDNCYSRFWRTMVDMSLLQFAPVWMNGHELPCEKCYE